MYRKETAWNSVDRIHVAEVKDRWWAVVSTVMNVQIYKKLAGS
jgi:hypothetical protein